MPRDFNHHLKNALGFLISKSGKSINELRYRMNWDRQNLNLLFDKTGPFRTDTLYKMCRILEIEIGEVFRLAELYSQQYNNDELRQAIYKGTRNVSV